MAIAGPKLELPESAGFWTAFLLSVLVSLFLWAVIFRLL